MTGNVDRTSNPSNEDYENALFAMRTTRDGMQRRLIEQDAEIERLTARVAELESSPGELHFRGVLADNAQIAADNDRLRAALEWYAGPGGYDYGIRAKKALRQSDEPTNAP